MESVPANNLAARPGNIRVLLVDDDEDDYLIVDSLLRGIPDSPFQLEWAASFSQGIDRINDTAHDAYLIDYRLGEHNGAELLKTVQAGRRTEPFIILTGAGDAKLEQAAVQLGAADYLVKGSFNAELLARTLRYALQRKQIEEQRVQHLIDINRAKDEFISLASHQLRTPATAVKQYLGMVIEGYVGGMNQQQKDMLTTAYHSNERQLQIVSDLLRVARVDAGRVRLTLAATDLGKLAEAVIGELQAKFKQQHQKITFNRPAEPITAYIDKENVRMVLENIIDNASKYSGQGTTITITLKKSAGQAAIHIIDQGVGIKPEDQDKLFIKFSRIDNPLSAEVGGSGLGLYWAKKIVDLHEGDITVQSQEGQGATFTITLPQNPPDTPLASNNQPKHKLNSG